MRLPNKQFQRRYSQQDQITNKIRPKDRICDVQEGLLNIVTMRKCVSHIAFSAVLSKDFISVLLV